MFEAPEAEKFLIFKEQQQQITMSGVFIDGSGAKMKQERSAGYQDQVCGPVRNFGFYLKCIRQ